MALDCSANIANSGATVKPYSGTTTTAIEDIELYITPNSNNEQAQLDQVLLMQIRDELAEINKKLDETQINERTVLDDVNKKIDEVVILLGVSL